MNSATLVKTGLACTTFCLVLWQVYALREQQGYGGASGVIALTDVLCWCSIGLVIKACIRKKAIPRAVGIMTGFTLLSFLTHPYLLAPRGNAMSYELKSPSLVHPKNGNFGR
jgi:hypothetical protein